jgi:uncharacterized phage-associated protein
VNELVQAWPYGPVFPSLYHEFKDFGGRAINRRATESRWVDGQFAIWKPSVEVEAPSADVDLPFAKAVIGRIWSAYGPIDAMRLSEITHEKGSPWWQVVQQAKERFQGAVPQSLSIPNEMIRAWFKRQSRTRPA